MRRFRTKRNGFTLVELIVVLAISALLAGLAIPSAIPWYQSQKALEREANAQTLYTTAQHNIVSLKSQGALGDYQGTYRTVSQASTDNGDLNRTTLASSIAAAGNAVEAAKDPAGEAGSADWDANLVVLDSAQTDANVQAALSLLVPNASTLISNSTFSGPFAGPGRYFVILNAHTGYIYGVFYSENADSEDTSPDYDDLYAHQDDTDWLTSHQVAFYGGVTQLPIKAEEQTIQTYVGYFELDDENNVTGLTAMARCRRPPTGRRGPCATSTDSLGTTMQFEDLPSVIDPDPTTKPAMTTISVRRCTETSRCVWRNVENGPQGAMTSTPSMRTSEPGPPAFPGPTETVTPSHSTSTRTSPPKSISARAVLPQAQPPPTRCARPNS